MKNKCIENFICFCVVWNMCLEVSYTQTNCLAITNWTTEQSLEQNIQQGTISSKGIGWQQDVQNIFESMVQVQPTALSPCLEDIFSSTINHTTTLIRDFLVKNLEEEIAVVRTGHRDAGNITEILQRSIRVTEYHIDTMSEKVLNEIVNSLATSPVKTVMVYVDEVEWLLMLRYLSKEMQRGLFFIRLTVSTNLHHLDEQCLYQLSVKRLMMETQNTRTTLLEEMLLAKLGCFLSRDNLVTAVGVLDGGVTMFEADHQISEFGDVLCPHESHPCRKATDSSGDEWITVCCAGFMVDVGSKVFDYLGYDWELYITPDNFYGGYENCTNPEDSWSCQWNGLVGEVMQGRADVALALLTHTSERMQVIDFTENVLTTNLAIAVKNEPEDLEFINWEFLQSLDWTLMSVLPLNLFIACCSMFMMEKILNSSEILRLRYPKKEAFSYGAGLTFQRDLAGKTPDNWAARLVAISYAVALTIIMSTYMANLTATNIVSDLSAIQGLKDKKILSPTSNFKYGIGKYTSTETYFKTNKMYASALNDATNVDFIYGGEPEGLEKVYKGELNGYISEAIVLETMIGESYWYCGSIKVVTDDTVTIANSIVTQKNSSLSKSISDALRFINGVNGLKVSKKKWLKTCDSESMSFYPFTAEYAGGLVVLVASFVLFALIVLTVETLYVHRRTKHKDRNGVIERHDENKQVDEKVAVFPTVKDNTVKEVGIDNKGVDFTDEAIHNLTLMY